MSLWDNIEKQIDVFLAGMITTPQPSGFMSTLVAARSEALIRLFHWRGAQRARKFHGCTKLRLHLGCGSNLKPGWINIDLARGADLMLDLRKPFPFDDSCCSIIYSEHFLEPVQYPETACSLLKQCYRVLDPGGLLSLVVPDGESVLRSYVLGWTEELYAAQKKWHPRWCRTQMEHVNFAFRQGGEHQFTYDFETLQCLLHRCGFVEVSRRSFNPLLDTKEREVGSLYVECAKPESEPQIPGVGTVGACASVSS
jgi:predicted SAM-dependent methyltransferase